MSIRKKIIASVSGLACAGIVAGFGPEALAGDCLIPGSADFNTFLLPIGTGVSASCTGGTTSQGQAPAGTSSSIKAKLIAGARASSGGYRANKTFIAGCEAQDTIVDATTITVSCVGLGTVAFHDLLVFD
jgi:hypothetical protein